MAAHNCYEARVPGAPKVSAMGRTAARKAALSAINEGRSKAGLKSVKRLPRGTKIVKTGKTCKV